MYNMHNKAPVQILVAEDEETDAFFVKKAFEQAEFKNDVHLVKNGEEALDFLYRRNGHENAPFPHIIFLDINMPLKNGHDALIEIKSSEEFRHIPVIMLSSSKAQEDVSKSYTNYASAHVPKANGFPDMIDLVNCVQQFWFQRTVLPNSVN